MDFKQFRYFVTVAEELHVGRAAEKLHMAQPALSQQIKHLEMRLRVSLFSREKRRLALTPAGSLFLAEARLALRQAAHAVHVARLAEKGNFGQIQIGYVDSAMLGISVGSILHGFKRSFPLIDLVLHGKSVTDQFAGLLDNEIDVGVVRGPIALLPAKLRAEVIEREPLVVCLPAKHRLGMRPSLAMQDLQDELFIMPTDPSGVGLAGQIEAIAQAAGFLPQVAQYAGQTTTVACLVAAELGIAILPASLTQMNLEKVIYCQLQEPVVTELHLIWRSDEEQPAVLSFLHYCNSCEKMLADDADASASSWDDGRVMFTTRASNGGDHTDCQHATSIV